MAQTYPKVDTKTQQRGFSVQNLNNLGSIRLVDYSDNTSIKDVDISTAKPAEGIPIGSIIMYYGRTDRIPSNWVFCDGSHGTPDLRSRFILGSTVAGRNQKGGSASIQMPAHSHAAFFTNTIGNHAHSVDFAKTVTSYSGEHAHTVYNYKGENVRVQSHQYNSQEPYNYGKGDHYAMEKKAKHTHSVTIPATTSTAGGKHNHAVSITTTTGQSAEGNLPLYFELAFLMKVK